MAVSIFNKEILSSTTISEGSWLDISTYSAPISIVVYGFAADGGDQVQIVTSNLTTTPALLPPVPGDGTIIQGWPTINQDGIYSIPCPYHWLRVRKSSASNTPALTKADCFSH